MFIIWITCSCAQVKRRLWSFIKLWVSDSGIVNFYWRCMNGEQCGMRCIQVSVYTGEQCKTRWAQPPVYCFFNVIFINPKTFKRLSKWLVISTLSTHALCPMLGSFQELWKRTGIPCLSVLYLPCDRKRSVFSVFKL